MALRKIHLPAKILSDFQSYSSRHQKLTVFPQTSPVLFTDAPPYSISSAIRLRGSGCPQRGHRGCWHAGRCPLSGQVWLSHGHPAVSLLPAGQSRSRGCSWSPWGKSHLSRSRGCSWGPRGTSHLSRSGGCSWSPRGKSHLSERHRARPARGFGGRTGARCAGVRAWECRRCRCRARRRGQERSWALTCTEGTAPGRVARTPRPRGIRPP